MGETMIRVKLTVKLPTMTKVWEEDVQESDIVGRVYHALRWGGPDTERVMQPNAPNRSCDSCGTKFRVRRIRCPACKSADIAPIVDRGRRSRIIDAKEQANEDTRWKELEAKMGFVAMPTDSGINHPTFACRRCQNAFRLRIRPCPKCGSHDIKRVVYGCTSMCPYEPDPGLSWGGPGRSGPDDSTKVCGDCRHSFGRFRR